MTVGDLPERLEGEARNPDHYSDNRPLTAARLLREAAARIRALEGEVENWRSRAAERDAECERRFRAQHAAEAALAKAVEGLDSFLAAYRARYMTGKGVRQSAPMRSEVGELALTLASIRQEPKG